MNAAVVSYSLTGNNDALAERVAEKLSAGHVKLTESKKRRMGAIITDLLFNKTPKVQPPPGEQGRFDRVVFVGPVWIGQAATPLRAYLKQLKTRPCRYAFVSISGGADGPNVKLGDDLEKWTGRKPDALVDLHIADLLPPEPKPVRRVTSAYKLNRKDAEKLADTVTSRLEEKEFMQ